MHMLLRRYKHDIKTTYGLLYVNGKFMCHTIEDTYRPEKVARETRIPSGTYAVNLRNEGGMTKRYAGKYPDMHKGMLWLRDVPNYEYVYIHLGNTAEHTEGCILTTMATDLSTGFGAKSAPAYKAVYAEVVEAAENGTLTIEIVDEDL